MINQKRANVMILVGYAALVVLLGLLALRSKPVTSTTDIGCRVVRLMYDFNTPADLVANQSELQKVLVLEEFERLTVDNELRVVNTYYKFQYSESHVQILEFAPGYVLYQILNPNVDSETLWVFQYQMNSEGLLENVREYRAMNVTEAEVA